MNISELGWKFYDADYVSKLLYFFTFYKKKLVENKLEIKFVPFFNEHVIAL